MEEIFGEGQSNAAYFHPCITESGPGMLRRGIVGRRYLNDTSVFPLTSFNTHLGPHQEQQLSAGIMEMSLCLSLQFRVNLVVPVAKRKVREHWAEVWICKWRFRSGRECVITGLGEDGDKKRVWW